jgi:hypothetical protein
MNRGLADDPFPLTPTLSLGERVKNSLFMVPMHISRMLMLPTNGRQSSLGLPHSTTLARVCKRYYFRPHANPFWSFNAP